MAEMMCIGMDPEDFKEDELSSDEFEDLSEPEYKLLTHCYVSFSNRFSPVLFATIAVSSSVLYYCYE
jgi:hypothetical protein